ncbi:FecR family protein [Chitinophaga vietnamensis]|uniref:FecR family protein n=1 Tax=Chitinophaga vietnamensis TaxID=2593957 RepID=UPI001177CC88|nr:FecR domain-containing protein [Chitinophaga vietnamensis]
MYQPTTEITDLIIRFINAPHDPALQEQIAMRKSESEEQAAYIEHMLQAWLQPAEKKTAPPPVTIPYWKTWSCAAITLAALLLVLGAFYFFHRPQTLLSNVNQTGYIDSFILSDGSKAVLNKNTAIRYPARFEKGKRYMEMSRGEAYFDVSGHSATIFEMKVNDVTLHTDAAAFNVRVDENGVILFVVRGKLSMEAGSGEPLSLTANMQGSWQKQQLRSERLHSQASLAWKTGRLRFNNVPLKEVLDAVNTYYDIQVEVPPSAQSALQRKLTANFDSEGPEQVLAVISKKLNVHITRDKEGRYYLTIK